MIFNLFAAPSLTRHPALTAWLYAATHLSARALMGGERRRRIREEGTYQMNKLLADVTSEVEWCQLRPLRSGTRRSWPKPLMKIKPILSGLASIALFFSGAAI